MNIDKLTNRRLGRYIDNAEIERYEHTKYKTLHVDRGRQIHVYGYVRKRQTGR